MLELYTAFLFILLYGFFVGRSVNKLSKLLDDAMDYGNILGWLRFNAIRLLAKDKVKFDFDISQCRENSNINDLQSNIQITYKEHAVLLNRGLLCQTCFSVWLMIPIAFGTFWFLNAYMGFDWKYFYYYILFNVCGLID